MKALIVKQFHFEAAHLLPGHLSADGSPGKCSQLHGHSYILQIGLYGIVQHFPTHPQEEAHTNEGFVMDFGTLGDIVKEQILKNFDHQYLNDIVPFRTTAEHLAYYIFGKLMKTNHWLFLNLEFVKLWEVQNSSYAQVNREDFDSETWQDMVTGAFIR
jgi:6-pyruvoyltetrahydropterin/6-carboxytetrahydropterin synthase